MTTVLTTRDAAVKKTVERILHRVLDVQIARTKKYGFVPLTFDPDHKGKSPPRAHRASRSVWPTTPRSCR